VLATSLAEPCTGHASTYPSNSVIHNNHAGANLITYRGADTSANLAPCPGTDAEWCMWSFLRPVRWCDLEWCDVLHRGDHLHLQRRSLLPVLATSLAEPCTGHASTYPSKPCTHPSYAGTNPIGASSLTSRAERLGDRDVDHRVLGLLQAELLME